MKLIDEIESINRQIRKEELKDRFDPDAPIYQERRRQSLESILEPLQSKLDKKEPASMEDIAEIAKKIVNQQIFVDANHRTGLTLCYYLSLNLLDKLPKIKPQYLYAAIDFEYWKSMQDIDKQDGKLYAGNAIYKALQSRAIADIRSSKLKESHFEAINMQIRQLPQLLESLEKVECPSAGQTMQKKLFSMFAGFRPHMSHSTAIDKSHQNSYAKLLGALDKPYAPMSSQELRSLNMNTGAKGKETSAKSLSPVSSFSSISIVSESEFADKEEKVADIAASFDASSPLKVGL